MRLWMVIVLVGLLKLPLVGLLLWLPFRSDSPVADVPDSPQDDGGSKTLPHPPHGRHPRRPLPHLPRRGPHGSAPTPPPERVRMTRARARQVSHHR
jgi:hypothetical protein